MSMPVPEEFDKTQREIEEDKIIEVAEELEDWLADQTFDYETYGHIHYHKCQQLIAVFIIERYL